MSHNRFCCKKFTFREIQDGGGRHFEIHFNGHNSITTHICTKFGTETKNNVPETELTSYFTSEQIQAGGGRHFEILFNGHNSYVIVEHIRTKFGTETRNNVQKTVLPSDFIS